MSLGQALATAMTGLRANQAALALVSSNVANAETPGYVKKSLVQIQTSTGDYGSSVRVVGVNRELDQFLQTQLRTETSGAAYADIRASFLANLQGVYGNPDSSGTLESAFNNLTTALQALSTSPDSQSARIGVVNAAQTMAQQLNATSQGIQSLRASAESGLNNAVTTANNALSQIATINNQLVNGQQTDASTAALLDQRDQFVTQLSQLMDIRVVTNNQNQVTVFTNSGVQLVGVQAAQLSFNAQGTMTPNTEWSSDSSQSNVGTIAINFPQGGSMDLVATGAIRSGAIAAYLELRDNSLVQAQAQVDQLAAAMASSLSDKTTPGTQLPAGPPDGYNLDLSGLQTGNVIHLTYKDNVTGVTHNLSIVRVDDPSVLPLPNSATSDPNDEVLGIDFSGGMTSVLSQLNSALGPSTGMQFSSTSPSTLTVLDDGAANRVDINAASVTTTALPMDLTGGSPQLSLFTDGGTAFTGAITAAGAQQTGLSARISVNPYLIADPSKLTIFSSSTASGDSTRANFILNQLTSASQYYSPKTGVGNTTAPYKGTLLSFTQQFLSMQGNAADAAKRLADGQDVVLNTLQNKMNASSGINIDDEMAHLLQLQTAYSANARVMSTVKDMYTALLQSM